MGIARMHGLGHAHAGHIREHARAAENRENGGHGLHGAARKMANGKGRRLAALALMGALAIGGMKAAERHIPVILRARPNYEMRTLFLRHDIPEHAERLLARADEAAEKGRPYRILFVENVGAQRGNYAETARAIDSKLGGIRKEYEALIGRGASPEGAERHCAELLKKQVPGMNDFNYRLYAGAGIRGMKVLYIEAYPQKEHEMMMEHNGYLAKWRAEFGSAAQNPKTTLGDLMRMELDFMKKDHAVQKMREGRIAREMEQKFRDAEKIFPELKKARGGKDLRAISYLGETHLPVYWNFGHGSKSITMDRERVQGPLPALSVEALLMQSRTGPGEREAYLAAMGEGFFDANIERLAKADPAAARRGVSRAMNLTLEQLRALDAQTAGMHGMEQKAKHIMNALLGADYFR